MNQMVICSILLSSSHLKEWNLTLQFFKYLQSVYKLAMIYKQSHEINLILCSQSHCKQ